MNAFVREAIAEKLGRAQLQEEIDDLRRRVREIELTAARRR